MRYSHQSLTFWCTVYKLFKGKGINFFRGYKGEGLGDEKSTIDFAVPSNPIITKEVARFTTDAGNPGILNIFLDAFAARHQGENIKLSIDGKNLQLVLEKWKILPEMSPRRH